MAATARHAPRAGRARPPPAQGPQGQPAPGARLTALLAGRDAALAAVRAQEVAGQLQVLEVGEGDEGAGHAPGDGGAAAAQPGNARVLPSGPARPRTAHAPLPRRGGARGAGLRDGPPCCTDLPAGQPIPMFSHTFCAVVHPRVQPKPSLVRLETICSCR